MGMRSVPPFSKKVFPANTRLLFFFLVFFFYLFFCFFLQAEMYLDQISKVQKSRLWAFPISQPTSKFFCFLLLGLVLVKVLVLNVG
uniref:Uncharacterized protein n=1 Tax=Rhizophora mucronata TaxID=61149 RepID=A0A2P2PIG0_RHIMU